MFQYFAEKATIQKAKNTKVIFGNNAFENATLFEGEKHGSNEIDLPLFDGLTQGFGLYEFTTGICSR